MVVKPVGGVGKVKAGGIVDRSWRGRGSICGVVRVCELVARCQARVTAELIILSIASADGVCKPPVAGWEKVGSTRTWLAGCCIVNDCITAPDDWGIIKVLVYVVGMRSSSSSSDSRATGGTVVAEPCCPG